MAASNNVDRANYGFDYVYTPAGSNDFKNIHVDIKIANERLLVTLTPDEEISTDDLNDAVRYVNHNELKKMRANIINECDVYVNSNGLEKRLVLEKDSANNINITKIL